jgi:hypothetical protein
MSILLNDGLRVEAPRPTDSRYGPYNSTSEALSAIPSYARYQGLTCGIIVAGQTVEYWFKDDILDGSLTLKSSGGASLSLQTFSFTTASVGSGSSLNFEMNIGRLYSLLGIETSYPSWLRVFGTSSGRAADSRVSPGLPFPSAGTGYFTEVITTESQLSLFMSPIPMVQQDGGNTYFTIKNNDIVSRVIEVTITAVVLVA